MIGLPTTLAAVLILAPALGGLLAGADRIITARLQRRRGPPLLQPFYDVLKLLGKESTTVNANSRFYISFSLLFTILAMALVFVGQDLLLSIFSFTLSFIFLVMAGYASHSPYSLIGAERELVQIMCYEPMLFIASFGIYEATGSFDVGRVLALDYPIIVKLPLIFLGLVYILAIKLRKSPFDLSTSHHGHQEIVKGITTEFTDVCLAMVEIKHWFDAVFMLSLLYIFLVWSHPASHLLAAAGCLAAYFAEILVDNSFARLRWKPALVTSWLVIAAVSFANFFILGLI